MMVFLSKHLKHITANRYPQSVAALLLLLCLMASQFLVPGCSSPEPSSESSTREAASQSEPKGKTEANSQEPSAAKDASAAAEKPLEKTPSPDLDLVMKAEDFDCILQWDKVNRYRITNKLGFQKEALQVAKSKNGGTFPVGTVIQLVPQEAMVKRKKGYSPKTNDWEFFFLAVDKSGTTIKDRGTTEVKNAFGGNCYSCHAKADPKWDLICEQKNGCDPIPLSGSVIESIQKSDPRCK